MAVRTSLVVLVGSLLVGATLIGTKALAATGPAAVDPRNDLAAPPVPSAPVQRGAAPPVAARAERVPSGNPLWAVPLRRLSATRDRPLFAPTRRQPPVVLNTPKAAPPALPPPPAEPDKPQLALIGTIAMGAADSIGVFVNPADKSVLRLKPGEDHNGWVLRVVRPRQVVLAKGRQTAVLDLPPPEPSKGVPAPPRAAPASRTTGAADVAPLPTAFTAPSASPAAAPPPAAAPSPVNAAKASGGFAPPHPMGPGILGQGIATTVIAPPVLTPPPPQKNPFARPGLP